MNRAIIPVLSLMAIGFFAADAAAPLPAPPAAPEGPGEAIRFIDPYEENAAAPNPLYFTSLTNKPWWNEKSESRLPVLVTEPIGMDRESAPVSVFCSFPAGTHPDSIRVVHPHGKEIPSQVRRVEGTTNLMEVVFLATMRGRGQMPLFIYYGKSAPAAAVPPAPDVCLGISEQPDGLMLHNNRLAAELNKVVGADGIMLFRGLKCHGAAYDQIGRFLQRDNGVQPGAQARVTENGPIRKTVTYADGAVTFSLYADSPLLYYVYAASASRQIHWLPGGDTVNDALFYEAADGLKRLPISYAGGNTQPVRIELTPWLKEGWLAIHDEARHETIGEFFDPKQGAASTMTLYSGYWTAIRSGPDPHGAVYCSRDAGIDSCRNAYIGWKNPLKTITGLPQQRFHPAVSVPVLGRDFIRMHLVGAKYNYRLDEHSATRYAAEVMEYGGNYFMFWGGERIQYMAPSTNANGLVAEPFLDELVRASHARGLGFSHGHQVTSPGMARELARRGADAIWLADEWGWRPTYGYHPLDEEQRRRWLAGTWDWSATNFSAAARADFKKKHGVELPDPPATTNLTDPAQFNLFRLLIDSNNRLFSDLAAAAREGNPDVLVTLTTSPGNLVVNRLETCGIHDLEDMADYLDSSCLDLYSNEPVWLNQMIKLERGGLGNRRPALIISGYVGWDDAAAVELNQYLQVMFGANALAYFILDRPCNYRSALGAKSAFEFIDYTGLGEFAARARPLEYAGILRDRDEFFAGLQRGENMGDGKGSAYDALVAHYMAAMRNLPANFIFSKYLTPELVAPYKVIVVPNDPVLSEERALVLKKFVEAGGGLIVEGDTILNPVIAGLAGVTRLGNPRVMTGAIAGTNAPLAGWSVDLKVPCVPAKTGAGVKVLATLPDGSPAVTLAMAGKGKVAWLAPLFGRNAGTESVAAGLRRLVESLAGYAPVEIVRDGQGVHSSVLTDGTNAMVCVYNKSAQPRRELALALSGFAPEYDCLLSLRQGRVIPLVQGRAEGLNLGANEVDFYRLVRSGSPALPPLSAAQAGNPVHQPTNAGMAFLRLEPLPSRDLQERIAKKDRNLVYVGVFRTPDNPLRPVEMGAEAMVAELKKMPGLKAETMAALDADAIAYYDVVIVPNKHAETGITKGWEGAIRRFVEKGGGALLVHHAVGQGVSSDASALFPEISQGGTILKGKRFVVAKNHPVMTGAAFRERFQHDLDNPAFAQMYRSTALAPNEEFDGGFPDAVALDPGDAAEVLAFNPDRTAPVIAAGQVGSRRVVWSGVGIGCQEVPTPGGKPRYEEAVGAGELKILVNSVYWLAAPRLEKSP